MGGKPDDLLLGHRTQENKLRKEQRKTRDQTREKKEDINTLIEDQIKKMDDLREAQQKERTATKSLTTEPPPANLENPAAQAAPPPAEALASAPAPAPAATPAPAPPPAAEAELDTTHITGKDYLYQEEEISDVVAERTREKLTPITQVPVGKKGYQGAELFTSQGTEKVIARVPGYGGENTDAKYSSLKNVATDTMRTYVTETILGNKELAGKPFQLAIPFNTDQSHWYAQTVEITKGADGQFTVTAHQHNPLGGGKVATRQREEIQEFLEPYLAVLNNFGRADEGEKSTIRAAAEGAIDDNSRPEEFFPTIESACSGFTSQTTEAQKIIFDYPEQSTCPVLQQDGTSCGPIVAEILAHEITSNTGVGQVNGGQAYPKGAVDLRKEHFDLLEARKARALTQAQEIAKAAKASAPAPAPAAASPTPAPAASPTPTVHTVSGPTPAPAPPPPPGPEPAPEPTAKRNAMRTERDAQRAAARQTEDKATEGPDEVINKQMKAMNDLLDAQQKERTATKSLATAPAEPDPDNLPAQAAPPPATRGAIPPPSPTPAPAPAPEAAPAPAEAPAPASSKQQLTRQNLIDIMRKELDITAPATGAETTPPENMIAVLKAHVEGQNVELQTEVDLIKKVQEKITQELKGDKKATKNAAQNIYELGERLGAKETALQEEQEKEKKAAPAAAPAKAAPEQNIYQEIQLKLKNHLLKLLKNKDINLEDKNVLVLDKIKETPDPKAQEVVEQLHKAIELHDAIAQDPKNKTKHNLTLEGLKKEVTELQKDLTSKMIEDPRISWTAGAGRKGKEGYKKGKGTAAGRDPKLKSELEGAKNQFEAAIEQGGGAPKGKYYQYETKKEYRPVRFYLRD